MTTIRRSILTEYLKSKGATTTKHIKEGSLLDHLLRTEKIVRAWGLSEDVCLVALCHSVYGTSFFKEALLSRDDRTTLQKIIGNKNEKIVVYFSILDRESFAVQGEKYTFNHITTQEKIYVTKEEFQALLHLTIANEVDHITNLNFEHRIIFLNTFLQFKEHLSEKTNEYLARFNLNTKQSLTGEMVTFLGHAGVWARSNHKEELVIDPWLYSSRRDRPIIQGIHPHQKTIDYLIPEPVHSIKDINASIILLSHFHTHHSPAEEIKYLISKRPVTIICPPLKEEALLTMSEMLGGELFSKITFMFCEKDTEIALGGFTIKAFTHTKRGHLGFWVVSDNLTFIHIADGKANKNENVTSIGDDWAKIYNSQPDVLFISSANHALREIDGIEPVILEHTTFSPVQAAKLTAMVQPKIVGLVGIYNFSIWDSKVEHTSGAPEIQEYFDWAISYLSPSISSVSLKPGFIYKPLHD